MQWECQGAASTGTKSQGRPGFHSFLGISQGGKGSGVLSSKSPFHPTRSAARDQGGRRRHPVLLGPAQSPCQFCLCPSPAPVAPASSADSSALPVFLHPAFPYPSLRDPVQPLDVPPHSRSHLILAAGRSVSPKRNGSASLPLILALSCSRPPSWALLSSPTRPRTQASRSKTPFRAAESPRPGCCHLLLEGTRLTPRFLGARGCPARSLRQGADAERWVAVGCCKGEGHSPAQGVRPAEGLCEVTV